MPSPVKPPAPPLVLVVEDSVLMQRFVMDALSSECRVIGASDGHEGGEMAAVLHPDLIVTDLVMPVVSGEEMIARLRRDPSFDRTPIVVLTGKDELEVRSFLLRNGAQDFLVKPFAAEELLARVRNLIIAQRAWAEVEANNQVLRRVSAELANANRELESFGYAVSHDLRAPLRAIDGFARVLEEDWGPTLPLEAQTHLMRVRRGAQRMGTMIDDLLALSRVAHRPVDYEHVDLTTLARRVFADLAEQSPTRRVEAHVEPGLVAYGDRGLIEVILMNLLGNAWKFTAQRDPAHITLKLVPEMPEPTFEVVDDGVGFEMAQVQRLFTPFQRLHSASDFEGSGVGLATTQRAVRRHGGSVTAYAEPGRGARFCFTLPTHDT